MSADLHDFRCKITAEADAVLEALSRSTGDDRCEIAREVLHQWALKQIHSATLIQRMVSREGIVGESEGRAGESKGKGAR